MNTLTLSKEAHMDLAKALAAKFPGFESNNTLAIGEGVVIHIDSSVLIPLELLPAMLEYKLDSSDVILSSEQDNWMDVLNQLTVEYQESKDLSIRVKAATQALEDVLVEFIGENATGLKTGLEVASAIYSTVAMVKTGGASKLGFWAKVRNTYGVPALSATACVIIDRVRDEHLRREAVKESASE